MLENKVDTYNAYLFKNYGLKPSNTVFIMSAPFNTGSQPAQKALNLFAKKRKTTKKDAPSLQSASFYKHAFR